MKKTSILFLLLLVILLLCSCTPATDPNSTQAVSPTQTADATPAPPTETATPAPPPSTATPAPSASASPGGMALYSSYAHMVSYDPACGSADFDYFEMLTGDDAVAWLVDHEGYTLSDAQAEVDDYADSEFIEKNTNPQLRTISLIDVPLKLMYHPDGTPLPGAEPIDAELIDLYNLYHVNHALVLDVYFYHITVEDGAIVSVEQVYWP